MICHKDGGQTALYCWVDPKRNKGTFILIPGLTASGTEPYIQNTVAEGIKAGFNLVLVHHRGSGGAMLTTP